MSNARTRVFAGTRGTSYVIFATKAAGFSRPRTLKRNVGCRFFVFWGAPSGKTVRLSIHHMIFARPFAWRAVSPATIANEEEWIEMTDVQDGPTF